MIQNKNLFIYLAVFILFLTSWANVASANEPDSVFVVGYSTSKNQGKNGLHFAWSHDKKHWSGIGGEHAFLKSDYGSWGGEKRMYAPFLFQDDQKQWHCLWTLNDRDGVLAHASSGDLINWKPQNYPSLLTDGNCKNIVVKREAAGKYLVEWESAKSGSSVYYQSATSDFKTYSEAKKIDKSAYNDSRSPIVIKGEKLIGTIHRVAWSVVDQLIKAQQLSAYKSQVINEYFYQDLAHVEKQKPVEASLHVDMADSKEISDVLIGIFFEDINYAADGGLYAELVQNRSFEYTPADTKGRDKSWNSTKSWSLTDSASAALQIDTLAPIHPNNKHYAVLTAKKAGAGLSNTGFAGIAVKEGEKYNFSVFSKKIADKAPKMLVRLVSSDNKVLASAKLKSASTKWQKKEAVLTVSKTENNARLEVVLQTEGKVAVDMISLFPQNTFKGRKNGLRADLAQTIADLHPRFVRFPGGCVVHGDGLDNIYRWKNTIGPLEQRNSQRNIWNYHQSYGLGFFEYFQFCEDLGAEPIPVVAAGVPCQNSSTGGAGQQGGLPMCEMDQYIQDILDLIEYCNGSSKTTWGKKRAEAGHPEPFKLKYIGIGNEDLISDIFKERFEVINKAVKEKYPDIQVIGTAGPFYEGSDYREGWELAGKLDVEIVDEHYYERPGWFINNQDYYDRYARDKSQVYLGEYASWGNSYYNALAEAIYLTAIERNAEVVKMASYAPLLAKEGATQWHTDMIFFNNTEIKPTPNYEVQKLFGQNAGNEYIYSYIKMPEIKEIQNKIGASVVRDGKTGDLIIKMVNILPTETKMNVVLDGWKNQGQKMIKTVLTGDPKDKKVSPKTKELTCGDKLEFSLPAHSVVVVRIKQ